MTTLPQLRQTYHNEIALQIVRFSRNAGESYPNFADGSSRSSVDISNGIAELLGFPMRSEPRLSGQTAGSLFEKLTCGFLREAFTAIQHLRPGRWEYLTTRTQISGFVQYRHLETLDALVSDNQTLSAALGHGYIVTPDIVVARYPATHEEVNTSREFLRNTSLAPSPHSWREISQPACRSCTPAFRASGRSEATVPKTPAPRRSTSFAIARATCRISWR